MANTTDHEPDGNGKKRKRTESLSRRPSKHRLGHTISLGDLPWSSVNHEEFISGFEDCGLDVVEGVHLPTAAPADNDKSEDANKSKIFDDTWEGFPDLPVVAGKAPDDAVKTTNETKGVKADKANGQPKAKEEKDGKKPKKAAKETRAEDTTSLTTGSYSLLADVDEEAGVDVADWVPLNLSQPLLSCVAKLGFRTPTAIQEASIPEVLDGHDVIAKASTGSGKTLVFAIPIVEKWLSVSAEREQRQAQQSKSEMKQSEGPVCPPIALILSPARDLAVQIAKDIKDLCSALPSAPYVCTVMGGMSVAKQKRQLKKADIIVATPGRLWDVLSDSEPLMKAFYSVAFLVVDEADWLLSDGHFNEADNILQALNRDGQSKRRQTILLSATFNKNLQRKLARKGQHIKGGQARSLQHVVEKLDFGKKVPKFIDVNPNSQMVEELEERFVNCGAMDKDLLLYTMLHLHHKTRTIVFANSMETVRRLMPMLKYLNINAIPLYSVMEQKARFRYLERFTDCVDERGAVLVATDVAARGLHIQKTDLIIHYHVPRTADTYVHRSGRTARAGRKGLSILLCSIEEMQSFSNINNMIHSTRNGNGPKRTLERMSIDQRLVGALKKHLDLAKGIADIDLAKEKARKKRQEDRKTAESLGVEYNSGNDEEEESRPLKGRGSAQQKRERMALKIPNATVRKMRKYLWKLLCQPIPQ